MQKRKKRTLSPLEAARAIQARRKRQRQEKTKPRRRPVFVPVAGPSLRELLRRRLEDYGARGRTVARFARSPWIGGSPKREIKPKR